MVKMTTVWVVVEQGDYHKFSGEITGVDAFWSSSEAEEYAEKIRVENNNLHPSIWGVPLKADH